MKSHRYHPALGSLDAIPAVARGLFSSDGFNSKRVPEPDDWLAQHQEDGQSLDDYRHSQPNRPDHQRNVIYLQPLGEFGGPLSPSLQTLERYARSYFLHDVGILPSISLAQSGVTERMNPHGGQRQLLTTDILRMLARRLPSDAYCVVGISMTDLYPDPNWNFVFGQASLRNRVGVYSFARYTAEGDARLTLKRSMKVMAHEIGHMHGLTHCVFFECGLNGSNHLGEADKRPPHLCPICLRKIQWGAGFDPVERYRELSAFYREHGFPEEAEFLTQRLQRCIN